MRMSARANPRRKCAFPWFQSETHECAKYLSSSFRLNFGSHNSQLQSLRATSRHTGKTQFRLSKPSFAFSYLKIQELTFGWGESIDQGCSFNPGLD
jgi:hypothetical protein